MFNNWVSVSTWSQTVIPSNWKCHFERLCSESIITREMKEIAFQLSLFSAPEVVPTRVVNKAVPITGTQRHSPHWQCCQDTQRSPHQTREPWLSHPSYKNHLTQILINAIEWHRKQRKGTDVPEQFDICLPNTISTLIPQKIPSSD